MSLQLQDSPPAEVDWDSTIDLAQFERLEDENRLRVIIRVLCGLVALEEEDWFDEPPDDRPAPRALPYLGYERHPHLVAPAERRPQLGRALPVLGHRRDF